MRNMNGNKDMTDEMFQTYIAAVDEETPDLWSRVERGFESEIIRMQSEKAAAPRRVIHWKRYMGIAAVVLICMIAVPLFLMNGNKSKSDTISYDMMSKEEEQYVAGDGIQENGMAEQTDSTPFVDYTEAFIQESMEDAPADSVKASVEENAATETQQEAADVISVVGRCQNIKK